jgi:hypothetical protein
MMAGFRSDKIKVNFVSNISATVLGSNSVLFHPWLTDDYKRFHRYIKKACDLLRAEATMHSGSSSGSQGTAFKKNRCLESVILGFATSALFGAPKVCLEIIVLQMCGGNGFVGRLLL